MIGHYNNVKICGIVSAVPDNRIDNMELASEFGEKVVKKQMRVTGIKKRYVAIDGQRAADLCITAGKRLMEQLSWNKEEVECLIFVSSYPSYKVPATAFFIQKELGIDRQCVSFDINLACSGLICGLETVGSLFLGRKEHTKALLFVADTTSESVDDKDKSTSILFGDCGCAVALESCEGYPMKFLQKADGNGYEDLLRVDGNHRFQMDGMGIFNFAISDVVDTIREFFEKIIVSKDDIDVFYLHQAQKFIVDKVRDFSGFPQEKVPITYDNFGNTGCASIPLTMCEHSHMLKKDGRTKVFFCGFGAGHSWGCAVLDINADIYLETCYSNTKYQDGRCL